MTNPGDQFPVTQQAELAEKIRASCPEHGSYYADVAEATFSLANISGASPDGDEFARRLDEAGPSVMKAWESSRAVQQLYENTTTKHALKIYQILTQSRTSAINPLGDELSTEFITSLGRQPDMIDIQNATLLFTFATALVRKRAWDARKDVAPDVESAVITQFTNTLLAKMDPSLLCQAYASNARRVDVEESVLAIASKGAETFRQMTGHSIDPSFIGAKLMSLWINSGNAMAAHKLKDDMHETANDTNIAEMRRANTEFAKHIQRVRTYGIKNIIFELGDILPGTDSVYHEFSDLGFPVKGEQPLALIHMVYSTLPAEEKVVLAPTPIGGVTDVLKGFDFAGLVLILDRHGDIFVGYGVSNSSVPLQKLFESSNASGKYETLRTALLSRLFDAIAPAEIVERITSTVRQTAPAANAPEHVSSSVIQRLLLPRLRYLESTKTRQLRDEFDAALHAEQEAIARQARYRHIAPYLRNLPAAAKGASETAISKAKDAFGPDFELPERKTFVSDYEVGSPEVGKVIGYIAVKRSRRGGKGGTGGKK